MGCDTHNTDGQRKVCREIFQRPCLPKIQEEYTMMRIVIDVYGEDTQGTKETVAMLLEPLGRVRVVQILIDGKEEKR